MKIKHFAGYGTVEATKISEKKVARGYGKPITKIKIRVKGNHERGLVPYIEDDAFDWLLVKHFGKKYNREQLVATVNEYVYEKGSDVDCVDFTFLVA